MMLRSVAQSLSRASTSRTGHTLLPLCTCRSASSTAASSSSSSSTTSTSQRLPTAARHASTSTQAADVDTTPTSQYSLMNGMMLEGTVTKTGVMSKTATVTVERQAINEKTLTPYKLHRKYLAHDPDEKTVVGDVVSIRHCKPVSKRKHFEVVRVVKGARERVVMDDAPDSLPEEDEPSPAAPTS